MDTSSTRLLSKIFIIIGSFLFLSNLVGFFYYTSINDKHPQVLDDTPRKVSEQEFWRKAYKEKHEDTEEYVKRLTILISDRMLLINPKYTIPTFFENYILWFFSKYLNYYEWRNTKKAIRSGGGFCSQHAIILNNILREQGIKSRIIGLTGHVLNEVLIGKKWKVYDPDYGLAFGMSLKELEADPAKVYKVYKDTGFTTEEAIHWQNIFSTDIDNWSYPTSANYAEKGYLIYITEIISFFLIWIIPIFLFFLGILINRYQLTRRHH